MRERTVMRGMARLFWRDSKTLPRQVLFGKADISTLLRQTCTSECQGKVESSAFRRVSDAVILLLFSAIPSMNIVLHRGHP